MKTARGDFWAHTSAHSLASSRADARRARRSRSRSSHRVGHPPRTRARAASWSGDVRGRPAHNRGIVGTPRLERSLHTMAPAAHPTEGALTVRKGMISRIECENFKYASLPPRGESSERRDPRASPPAPPPPIFLGRAAEIPPPVASLSSQVVQGPPGHRPVQAVHVHHRPQRQR